MPEAIGFAGGALMGLASSLHCASFCGGIASALMLASPGAETGPERLTVALRLQVGRLATYVVFGMLVGGVGSAFAELLSLAGLQLMFRILATLALMWSGLAIAGAVPSFAGLDGRVPGLFADAQRLFPIGPSPFVSGLMWGLAPCGMVYAALLNASLTGSPWSGGALMAGFGLATIPAVVASALGIGSLAKFGRSCREAGRYRIMVGLSLAGIGVAGLAQSSPGIAAFCTGSG